MRHIYKAGIKYIFRLSYGFCQAYKRRSDHGDCWHAFLFKVELINDQPCGARPSIPLSTNGDIRFKFTELLGKLLTLVRI